MTYLEAIKIIGIIWIILTIAINLLLWKKKYKIMVTFILIILLFIALYNTISMPVSTYDTKTESKTYEITQINTNGEVTYKYKEKELLTVNIFYGYNNTTVVLDTSIKEPEYVIITTTEYQRTDSKFIRYKPIERKNYSYRYEIRLPETIYNKLFIWKK